MATARVSWASFEIEPYDMAPVANRLTISLAGSTSSRGTGPPEAESSAAHVNSSRPRSVSSFVCCSSISRWYFRNSSRLLICVDRWSDATTSGASTWASPFRRQA